MTTSNLVRQLTLDTLRSISPANTSKIIDAAETLVVTANQDVLESTCRFWEYNEVLGLTPSKHEIYLDENNNWNCKGCHPNGSNRPYLNRCLALPVIDFKVANDWQLFSKMKLNNAGYSELPKPCVRVDDYSSAGQHYKYVGYDQHEAHEIWLKNKSYWQQIWKLLLYIPIDWLVSVWQPFIEEYKETTGIDAVSDVIQFNCFMYALLKLWASYRLDMALMLLPSQVDLITICQQVILGWISSKDQQHLASLAIEDLRQALLNGSQTIDFK